MSDADLPDDLSSITLRPIPPLSAAQHSEPESRARGAAGGQQGPGWPGGDSGFNGPGGQSEVCASAPVDPFAPAPTTPTRPEPGQPAEQAVAAAPLIPAQPLPPGAPAALSEALSTGSTGLSTQQHCEPESRAREVLNTTHSTASPSAGLAEGAPGSTPASLAPTPLPRPKQVPASKTPGVALPHFNQPQTPQQVSAFADMWHDSALKVEQIARHYEASRHTITAWAKKFGLPDRIHAMEIGDRARRLAASGAEPLSGPGAARIVGDAADLVAPAFSAVAGRLVDPKSWDPLSDPEIKASLDDLRGEALIMTAHSDLTTVQRKLARLSLLVATKAPTASWVSFQNVVEGLSRALLNARRIEAKIPRGQVDASTLRREAAASLMKEMKSVLGPEEQAALATLVKAAAERLMARGGVVPAEVVSAGGTA